jgi:hypothetical protein
VDASERRVDSSLWYWSLRWRWQAPHDLAVLDHLEPRAALRVALLVDHNDAKREEIAHHLSKEQAAQLGHLWSLNYGIRPKPAIVAEMVHRRMLVGDLLAVVSGQLTWSLPERIEHDLVDRAIAVLPHALAVEDAALLEQLLQRPNGPLVNHLTSRTEVVRVLMDLLPDDRAEVVRMQELQRRPALHGVAADLIRQSAWKYWPLIKQSYFTAGKWPDVDWRRTIISAIAEQGQAAKPKLAELLATDDLTTLPPDKYYVPQQMGLIAFVEAANRLSKEGPIVSEELLRRSLIHMGKGASEPISSQSAQVAGPRKEIIKKLSAFFTAKDE